MTKNKKAKNCERSAKKLKRKNFKKSQKEAKKI